MTVKQVTDQMGRLVAVPQRPSRIISLVPSQTELLFDLGLADAIVGRTRFCVHPADKIVAVPIVGGTKKFRFDLIEQLEPDLIIGNKEENYEEGIHRLAASYPVWMSDIVTLGDALAMIRQIGALVGKQKLAETLADTIQTRFEELPQLQRPLRVGYFIWQKPYMVVGKNTFIDAMLTQCGFVNAFAASGNGRYPEVDREQIQAAALDVILLSSEPFPFAEKHRQAFVEQFSGVDVRIVDGAMFSWYGSHLLVAAGYLRRLVTAFNQSLT